MNLASIEQAVTMTSLEIAELTGKRHSHVLRDIRAMLNHVYDLDYKHWDGEPGIHGITIEHKHTEYRNHIYMRLDEQHAMTLLIGYTGYNTKNRFKVIRYWQALKSQFALRDAKFAMAGIWEK